MGPPPKPISHHQQVQPRPKPVLPQSTTYPPHMQHPPRHVVNAPPPMAVSLASNHSTATPNSVGSRGSAPAQRDVFILNPTAPDDRYGDDIILHIINHTPPEVPRPLPTTRTPTMATSTTAHITPRPPPFSPEEMKEPAYWEQSPHLVGPPSAPLRTPITTTTPNQAPPPAISYRENVVVYDVDGKPIH